MIKIKNNLKIKVNKKKLHKQKYHLKEKKKLKIFLVVQNNVIFFDYYLKFNLI